MSGEAAEGDPPRRVAGAANLLAWLIPVLVIAAIGFIYLSPYMRHPSWPPVGVDTAGYVWRANIVSERGVEALPNLEDRPGQPILATVVGGTLEADAVEVAKVWPAVIGVGIGLAAAGFARMGAGTLPSVAARVGIAVAGSAFIAVTAIGNAANLLADLFIISAIALAIRVVAGGSGAPAIIALIAAVAVTHWMFAAILTGLTAFIAVVSMIGKAVRRDVGRAADTPGHLAVALAIGVTVAGAAMLAASAIPERGIPAAFPRGAAGKIEKRLPPLALPLTLPLAAGGAVAIAAIGKRDQRRTVPPLLAWAAIAPAGLIAWYGFDVAIPPHRGAAAALGIPLLITLGIGAIVAWALERHRRVAVMFSVLGLIAAAVGLVFAGISVWWNLRTPVTPTEFRHASVVQAYLDAVDHGTEVIIPVRPGASPALPLKMALDPADLAAVEQRPWRRRDRIDEFLDSLPAGRGRRAVLFLPSATDLSRVPAGSGTPLAAGVVLLRGPKPPDALEIMELRHGTGRLIGLAIGGLVLLAVVGSGWTIALTALRPSEAAFLSPAIGAAIVVVGGLIWDRLGFSLGHDAWAFATLATATGWVAAFLATRVRSRGGRSTTVPRPADRSSTG